MSDDPYDMRANSVYKLREELAFALTERDALRAENARLTELLAEESKEVVRLQCAALALTGKNTTLHQMLRHIQAVDPEWVTYISAAMGESDE